MRHLLSLLMLAIYLLADTQLAPDGTYTQGAPTLTPSGTYVGSSNEQVVITPTGTYIEAPIPNTNPNSPKGTSK